MGDLNLTDFDKDETYQVMIDEWGGKRGINDRDKAWAAFIDYQKRKSAWERGEDYCPDDIEF